MGLFNAAKHLVEEFKVANKIATHLNAATSDDEVVKIANEKTTLAEERYGRNSTEAKYQREVNSKVAQSAVSSAAGHRQQAAILRNQGN